MLTRIVRLQLVCLAFLPVLLVPSLGVGLATGSGWGNHPSSSGVESASNGLGGNLLHLKVVARCPNLGGASVDAYDPADGYLYVGQGFAPAQIFVVEPPCHVLKTIHSSRPALSGEVDGFVYDPLTKEIVAFDSGGLAYVLKAATLVDTVNLGASTFHCPSLGSWDPDLVTILVADYCGGGVDLLYLSVVNGTTKGSAILDVFDQGNLPEGVLDADGYIFAAGNLIDVFDQRTLAYIGSFALTVIPTGYLTELAWDAFNHTVVVGTGFDFSFQSRDAVYFLHVDSIRTHAFSFGRLPAHDILNDGAGGVAYSPANHAVYVSAAGGSDVWTVSPPGSLQHIYLQKFGGLGWIAYDPANQDLFVTGPFAMYVVT